jgi:hypothetical protein
VCRNDRNGKRRVEIVGMIGNVRGYRGMLCEDAWSDLADLRSRESLANSIKFAGGSAEMRRYSI